MQDNDDATISFRKVYEMVEKGWMELEDVSSPLATHLPTLTQRQASSPPMGEEGGCGEPACYLPSVHSNTAWSAIE